MVVFSPHQPRTFPLVQPSFASQIGEKLSDVRVEAVMARLLVYALAGSLSGVLTYRFLKWRHYRLRWLPAGPLATLSSTAAIDIAQHVIRHRPPRPFKVVGDATDHSGNLGTPPSPTVFDSSEEPAIPEHPFPEEWRPPADYLTVEEQPLADAALVDAFNPLGSPLPSAFEGAWTAQGSFTQDLKDTRRMSHPDWGVWLISSSCDTEEKQREALRRTFLLPIAIAIHRNADLARWIRNSVNEASRNSHQFDQLVRPIVESLGTLLSTNATDLAYYLSKLQILLDRSRLADNSKWQFVADLLRLNIQFYQATRESWQGSIIPDPIQVTATDPTYSQPRLVAQKPVLHMAYLKSPEEFRALQACTFQQ